MGLRAANSAVLAERARAVTAEASVRRRRPRWNAVHKVVLRRVALGKAAAGSKARVVVVHQQADLAPALERAADAAASAAVVLVAVVLVAAALVVEDRAAEAAATPEAVVEAAVAVDMVAADMVVEEMVVEEMAEAVATSLRT